MAKKATEIYQAAPEHYYGFDNVKTGRILAIIGLVLSALYFIVVIIMFIIYGGIEGIQRAQEEVWRTYGG